MLAVTESVGLGPRREVAVGPEGLSWVEALESASPRLQRNSFIEHIDFFIGVSIVDKFGIVIVILSWLQEWLVGWRQRQQT